MTSLKMLNGYLEAELVSARVGASKMGFFVGSGDEDYVGEEYENEYAPIMNAEAGTFEQLPNGTSSRNFLTLTTLTQLFLIFKKQSYEK